MYEYIEGTLKRIDPNVAIVDNGGIGYLIHIPSNSHIESPQIGSKVLFYIVQVIREDSNKLYGFLQKQKRDLFLKLESVSGIGPKTALALLSHLEIETFYQAIIHANVNLLIKVPGIGKKTAERLILDMKDKLKDFKISSFPLSSNPYISDAISALLNLGYDPQKAHKAVQTVVDDFKDPLDLSSLIKEALRKL